MCEPHPCNDGNASKKADARFCFPTLPPLALEEDFLC